MCSYFSSKITLISVLFQQKLHITHAGNALYSRDLEGMLLVGGRHGGQVIRRE